MTICCSDLLQLKNFQKIQLLAGEAGLYRQVTLPYLSTATTISRWVHGGELLFINGAGIKTDENSLCLLMHQAVDLKLAGMVIILNKKYITTIPPSLIDLANRSSFPLFEMPWEVKFIDVLQEILQLIMDHRELYEKHVLFLDQLLFSNAQDYSLEELAGYYSIKVRNFRTVAAISIDDSNHRQWDAIKRDIVHTLKRYTQKTQSEIVCKDYINMVICLAMSDTTDSMKQLDASLNETFAKLETHYPQAGLKLGVGRVCKKGDRIRQSFIDAQKVLALMDKNLLAASALHYSDLGVYRLLSEIESAEAIQNYCMENIGRLIEADRGNHSELVKTLRFYLYNNCNLLKTSQALFIHRNTLIYRLNLIKDILEKDLSDALVRHELFLSLIASEFLGNP